MKKILFMCINMNVGGTEKALINMLNEIDNNKYDVTLFMLEQYGEFLSQIPSFVKIKYLTNYDSIKPFIKEPPHILAKKLIKNKKYLKGFNTLFNYSISKITKDISNYYRYILKNYKKLDEEYDLAVAYAGPMDFITYFVLNKIKAKKKVQWIHFDITKIGFNKVFAIKNYKKFDKIFVVSKEGKDKLLNLIPLLEKKVEVFFNIMSSNLIKDMSNNEKSFDDEFNGLRILTVARLTNQKGQDITIPILKRLLDEGYNLKWYCIGEGINREKYIRKIRSFNIENNYILLGNKLNPYPYIKYCDIYVQPSRFEGYCITLAEARCFNNPIITTNFVGANEQIEHEVTGLICNINEEEIYLALKRLLDDKELFNKIKNNLDKEVVDSTNEINKLYSLLY